MKTFDKKDLITWSNRHNAKVGDKGYFAHSIDDLDVNIENGYVHKLINISNYYACCFAYDSRRGYGFFLPVEAVKEDKTYRPCKDLRELYITIYGDSSPDLLSNEDIIYYLVRKTIKFRLKDGKTQYYECITGIVVYDNGDIGIEINCAQYSFKELFKCYEIEINGEWVPFGVLEK